MPSLPRPPTSLLAVACGIIVANLYYAQPLVALIGADLDLAPDLRGLVTTLTQLGYGLGLILLVPLADLLENRNLAVGILVAGTLALVGAAVAPVAWVFLPMVFFVGLGSVTVQVLVPYASHFAPEADRGKVVGQVMGGLLAGILLARPAASFLAQATSWRVVFLTSAAIMVVVGVILYLALPRRVPPQRPRYRDLLQSIATLIRTQPLLRRKAFHHACLFAAFSLFWTTVPLKLSAMGLDQSAIGWFALAGVAGAVAAPLAGRWTRGIGGASILVRLVVAVGFLLALLGNTLSWPIVILLLAAIIIDFGVSAHLVFAQRQIFGLGTAIRGRINGVFMATFFVGGALGSASGVWLYAHGGWVPAAAVGAGLALLSLAFPEKSVAAEA
jgi:predicted MFS family arabinose efflux permease